MHDSEAHPWTVSGWLMAAYALLVYAFLFAPIVVVVLMSFNSNRYSGFPLESFSLRWYADLFADITIWEALRRSIIIGVCTTILATTLGLMGAYALSRFKFPGKSAYTAILITPLIVPGVIMGVSLLSFYNFFSIRTGLVTVILAHTALAIPYTTLVIAARLQGFDRRLEEAGASLGAPYPRVFMKITLPLLAPGIIAAALFAWTISFDEFVITNFIAGGAGQTMPLKIYSLLKWGLSPSINAVSSIIMVASLTLVFSALALARKNT